MTLPTGPLSELDLTKAKLAKAAHDLGNAQQRCLALEVKVEDQQQRIESLSRQVSTLSVDLTAARTILEEGAEAMKNWSARAVDAEAALEGATYIAEQRKNQIEEQSEMIAELKKDLELRDEMLRTNAECSEREFDKMNRENLELYAAITQHQAEIRGLVAALARAQSQICDLERENRLKDE